ncbi:MAG: aminopeptidase [Planctomycetaceae bacterium]|nr:aminopeptidase [Planctomycetaceae bacterium]
MQRLLVAFLAVVSLSVSLQARAGDAIDSVARLTEHMKYLASDDLEGRGVGTEGLNKAADFIRKEFESAGLDVTKVDGGAFQKFNMTTGSKLLEPNSLTFVGPEGKKIELKMTKDFNVCSFGGSGKFEQEIVFLGYGIDSKPYNDFKDVDVKDKVVIIMRRTPQQGNPHGPFPSVHGRMSRHAALTTKVSNAFRKGAAAIIFVSDPHSSREKVAETESFIAKTEKQVVDAAIALEKTPADNAEKLATARKQLSDAVKRVERARASKGDSKDPLMNFGYAGNGRPNAVPTFHITQEVCDQLLKATRDKTLAQLEADIDKDLKPQNGVLKGWKAVGETSLETVQTEVKNVIGVLEGEGPLADQTIVIGAHYDHVGMGGSFSLARGVTAVHNGADDNASGTVSLIELAHRFGSAEKKPSRRMVFIAFTAEESGLIGSAHYVNKAPLYPLDNTIAMFNMDMVGRLKDEKLTVFGVGTAPRWKEQIEEAGTRHGFNVTLKPDGFGPSDQSSFYSKKIPVLHFFTGTHSDYHRPGDDWQKINVEGMNRISTMIEGVIVATDRNEDRPKYLEVKRKTTAGRSGNRPYFGSIPDFGTNAKGYAIQGVAGGSPAEVAGMKGGDVIVLLGGQKIGGLDDFDLALRKFKPGDEVEVVVLRKGKQVKLKVHLGKPR